MNRLLPVIALLTTGCAATVTCPEPASPAATVHLLDHGRHASIVLPAPRGRLVRYSYGDRRWYAEGDTGIWQGAAALLRRTPAVLGRRELRPRPGLDDVAGLLRIAVEHAYTLRVDAGMADALRRELDALFYSGADAVRYNPVYDLEFVPHPRDYTGWFNSNHMIAEWLGAVGCRVRGSPMFSNWRVP